MTHGQSTVSYTHLDVYKRQGIGMVFVVDADKADEITAYINANTDDHAPVSYTHLDVYKRQVVISILGYELGSFLKRKCKLAIFNPLLLAVLFVMATLSILRIDYQVSVSYTHLKRCF